MKKETWRLILAFALRKRNDQIVDALKPASSCQKVNDNAMKCWISVTHNNSDLIGTC